ncbi:MAG: hypothetical protein ACE5GA_01225, partial [Candidatus Zixiibacteriota bacterium]
MALVILFPAQAAFCVQPGIRAEFQVVGSTITPRPGFGERTVFSISPRFTVTPRLRLRQNYRTQVVGSSYHGRRITLRLAYYRNAYYMPLTLDGYDFFKWRSELETQDQIRVASFTQLRARDESRGGLRVTIPIKSKAVEALFGEGGAGLQVSGSRRISFAGTSNWTEGASSVLNNQSKFPSLRMDQTFQFDIVGTIGSKIFVKVNQDSRVNVPLANRLEIRFRGSEDDVVKTIEAGNTTLALPGASLLRYSSQVRGLFGIKAEAQVGPLRWTGIASQEKANTERASVISGATAQGDTLRDFEFERYRKFDLGVSAGAGAHFEHPDDSIVAFQVYEEVTASGENPISARMYTDPRPHLLTPGAVRDSSQSSGQNGEGVAVAEVGIDEYFIDSRERTLIFERRQARRGSFLGVWLRMKRSKDNPNGVGTYEIGDVTSDPNNLVLKLIKLDVDKPGTAVQDYEWLNMYRIPTSLGFDFENPDFDALDVSVYKGEFGAESLPSNLDDQGGIPYIQIIGMDQFSSTGKTPDLKADLNTELFDVERRLLILPARRPFDTDTTFGTNAPQLAERVSGIYTTTIPTPDRNDASTYYFVFTSKTRSNSIRLSGVNIVEGSEVVTSG